MSLEAQKLIMIKGNCCNCTAPVENVVIPNKFMAAFSDPKVWVKTRYALNIPCEKCRHNYADCTDVIIAQLGD